MIVAGKFSWAGELPGGEIDLGGDIDLVEAIDLSREIDLVEEGHLILLSV